MKIEDIHNYLVDFPSFDSITKLPLYIGGDNHSDNDIKLLEFILFDKLKKIATHNVKVSIYKSSQFSLGVNVCTYNTIDSNVVNAVKGIAENSSVEVGGVATSDVKNHLIYFVFNSIDGNTRTVCLSDLVSWDSTIMYWNSHKYSYPKWIDEKVNDSKFIRSISNYRYHVENGFIKFW